MSGRVYTMAVMAKSGIQIIHHDDGTYTVVAFGGEFYVRSADAQKSLHTAFVKATGRDDYSVSRACTTLKQVLTLIESGE